MNEEKTPDNGSKDELSGEKEIVLKKSTLLPSMPADDAASAKDMKEIIRVLLTTKEKISKTKNIKNRELKQNYIKRLDSIIEDYKTYEVSYDLLNRYFELFDMAKKFSLIFRIHETEKEFIKRINGYFSFFEAAKLDFAENGKWLQTIKMLFFSVMFCLALLVPPVFLAINGTLQKRAYGLIFAVCVVIFVTIGILVNRQLNKRSKLSMALCICFLPVSLMIALYWVSMGVSVAASTWSQPILYRLLSLSFPILSIVLLILIIILSMKLYKYRKQFI